MTNIPKKRPTLVYLGFAALLVILTAIGITFYLKNSATPAHSLLEKRLQATIATSWGWLHAEKPTITSLDCTGSLCQATIRYTLVIGKNEVDLLPEQTRRFRHFLPMCSDVLILVGGKCAVTETVIFTDTPKYGWIPLAAEQFTPDLLPTIAGWETNSTPR